VIVVLRLTRYTLCVCGHARSGHDDLASGDARCLAVEDRRDLLAVFDDGREDVYGYCACLRFRAAQPAGRRRPSPLNSRQMDDRRHALAEVLGSVRLEDSEPTPEMRAALDRWADGELDDAELAELARRAAAGEPLSLPGD
jgi:Antitoxin VbhA